MIRAVELGLFVLPFVLFAVWWFLGKTASRGLVWTAVVGLAVMAAYLAWYGLSRSMDREETYVPAHLEHGQIVPGRGVMPP